MEELKYPIGRFSAPSEFSEEIWQSNLEALRVFPESLKAILPKIDLNKAYREGGWTAKQVIHHLADSHMNMLVRVKWTLTENTPTIKAYHENLWAELPDYSLPVEIAVKQLEVIHERVVHLLNSVSHAERKKSYLHPENGKHFSLETLSSLYTWHGKHHLAHLALCT